MAHHPRLSPVYGSLELTAAVALETYRARFNHAFGIDRRYSRRASTAPYQEHRDDERS
jgi:hypothetical protein